MTDNKKQITKHWLFDFDGTLVDSMPYWSDCMISVLDDHNIAHRDDLINIITPLGTAGTVAYFQKIGLNMPAKEIINEIASKLTPYYLNIIPAKNNVIHCLERMKAAGFKIHVFENGFAAEGYYAAKFYFSTAFFSEIYVFIY